MDSISQLVPEFSELDYLTANPDVKNAVTQGVFRTGWEHFLLYGHAENRPGSPVAIPAPVEQVLNNPKSLPLPPSKLRARVHGAEDEASFLRLGKTVALDVYATLSWLEYPPTNLLDFGCGSGRVISWLSYLFPQTQFSGTDIDAEAIRWCQKNLISLGNFGVNPNLPPLDYADNAFDSLISISIFTHLPETMQFDWLAELARVVKPGGVLLLTTHDAALLPAEAGHAARDGLASNGFYFLDGKGTPGLPDFYQNSYHRHDYIHEHWTEYLNIVDILPQGIAGHQDLVIARAR